MYINECSCYYVCYVDNIKYLGKSTLMQVIMKELPLIDGSMGINGSISYASQENWIFASTGMVLSTYDTFH